MKELQLKKLSHQLMK